MPWLALGVMTSLVLRTLLDKYLALQTAVSIAFEHVPGQSKCNNSKTKLSKLMSMTQRTAFLHWQPKKALPCRPAQTPLTAFIKHRRITCDSQGYRPKVSLVHGSPIM